MQGQRQGRQEDQRRQAVKLHATGAKADRDRAALLLSYREMCRVLRVPRGQRVAPEKLAAMTTPQVFQLCKDLYNTASAKKARKLVARLMPSDKRLRFRQFSLKYRVQAFGARVWLWFFHLKRRLVHA